MSLKKGDSVEVFDIKYHNIYSNYTSFITIQNNNILFFFENIIKTFVNRTVNITEPNDKILFFVRHLIVQGKILNTTYLILKMRQVITTSYTNFPG